MVFLFTKNTSFAGSFSCNGIKAIACATQYSQIEKKLLVLFRVWIVFLLDSDVCM